MVSWQDVRDLGLNLFKKKSRSRRLWIGGGAVSFLGVLGYLILLAGVTITTSGDVFCDDADCTNATIYANITSTYWEICFNDTDFAPLYFDKEPLDYEVFVPARGKDNWRPLKVGDCIKRKNKYNVLPNRFKIIVYKEPWQTLKYGVKFSLTDLDPFIFGTNVKQIKGKIYVQECIEQFEEVKEVEKYSCEETAEKITYENITMGYPIAYNKSCTNTIFNASGDIFCNSTFIKTNIKTEEMQISSICERTILVNKSIGCIKTGVLKEGETEYKVDRHFCGVTDKEEIVCDERYDILGGGADGDGNAVCSPGETCVRYVDGKPQRYQ